ncbi:cation-transporting P-type ATPase [soil metagenome]
MIGSSATLTPVPKLRWHAVAVEPVLAALGVGHDGLSEVEAARRLSAFGSNRLPHVKGRGAVVRLLAQFNNVLIYVLAAAAATSIALGHWVDAAVVLGVVVANAILGFIQEGRAERALDAIRAMIDPSASVLRDGHRRSVAAEAIVQGDGGLIEAGARVPADIRLIRARSLKIDESALTGESVPVDKTARHVAEAAALGERTCLAFSGTFVAGGQGAGVVVATGADTELGRINALISAVEPLETPLTAQMNRFTREITVYVLIAAAAVFFFAWLARGYAAADAFMAVVGLAVAAMPEELPTIMTITLAIGVQRMAARHTIIRRLPALETLGSVLVVCTDKTGMWTLNEMTARSVVVATGTYEATGDGPSPDGLLRGNETAPERDPVLAELVRAAILCNDADLQRHGGRWRADGDPMESALVALGMKAGADPARLRLEFPRKDEIPFDAQHRFMATLNGGGDGAFILIKGAPERVLAMCAAERTGDGQQPLRVAAWEKTAASLAQRGERVLAFATKPARSGQTNLGFGDVDADATLLGFVGFLDPPRPEAITAVRECQAAGIRVVMITGDHAGTAAAIARQLGIAAEPKVLTGVDLDAMDQAELRAAVGEAAVFARATPEHKLRPVEALQANGLVVAMTGDGVNDAPALKRADVGVAMGGKGTEVAKEAAGMVLADDNFASVVAAVREGRTVYDNLMKVIAAALPTNGGEAMTIVAAILFGFALPMTPVQILWINMVTTVALGLTLAFEPTEPGTMQRPPRPADRPILTGDLAWRILFVSALFVAGAFGVFFWAEAVGRPVETARTMVVNAIVAMEVFYLFSVRYAHGASLTWRGLLGTRAVLLVVAGVTACQFAFTYLPPFQAAFDTRPLSFGDGLITVAVGAALLLVVEAEKLVRRRIWGAGG